MRDYYAEYIRRKPKNISETQVSKVSKGQFDNKKEAFDTFDTEHCNINQKKDRLELWLSTDTDLREQFEFEVSERIAIMIFDGKVAEKEAIELARKEIFRMWCSLFGE